MRKKYSEKINKSDKINPNLIKKRLQNKINYIKIALNDISNEFKRRCSESKYSKIC